MADLKDIIKPPFQNYDIVVYFGVGLFSLPFAHHYFMKPLDLRLPHFQFGIGQEFADAAISTLSLLFSVYLIGHLLAYFGSLMIEKTIDRSLGKMSSSVIIPLSNSRTSLPITIRSWIKRCLRSAFRKGRRTTSTLRALSLLPVIVGVLIAFKFDYFGYFKTRIPPQIYEKVRVRCRSEGYGPVGLRSRWYKSLEHYVTNNMPIATARMYNYLVIAGIFRSLGIIFLGAAWAELYYLIHQWIDGDQLVDAIMADDAARWHGVFNVIGYNLLFTFSVTAYVKFTRRYVEEAMFAFVLTKES